MGTPICSGEVFWVGKAASCQFSVYPILFRVIREHTQWNTYEDWVWLDGYELYPTTGAAKDRRSIWVLREGLVRWDRARARMSASLVRGS